MSNKNSLVTVRKRLWARAVAIVLIAGLFISIAAGCGQEQGTDSKDDPVAKLRIVCSTFPIYLITKNVSKGWEGGEVELLIDAALGCPHDYALTPQNMQTLAKADVLIINGLGLEEFLGKPVERANAEIKTIDSSAAISEYIDLGEDVDHSHDNEHRPKVNPHLFSSPHPSGEIAIYIADELARLSPEDADLFAANAKAFQAEMEQLIADFHVVLDAVPNNRIVTQHGAFDYLARDVGLNIVAVTQAHGGKDPSAAEMLEIVRTIREKRAAAVFTEPQYPGRIAATIAAEAGIPAAELDPVASGPNDAKIDHYQKAMRRNIETLKRILGGNGG